MRFSYASKKAALMLAIAVITATMPTLPEIRAGEMPEIRAGEVPEIRAGEMPETRAGEIPEIVSGVNSDDGDSPVLEVKSSSENGSASRNNSASGNGSASGNNSTSGNGSASGNSNDSRNDQDSGDQSASENETPSGNDIPDYIQRFDGVIVRSLSSNFTKPHVFLTKKKIKINGLRRQVSEDTCLMVNVDGNYELTGLNTAGNLSFITEKTSCNSLPAFRITVSSTSAVTGGTYKFNLKVRDMTSGAESDIAKLTVVVQKKNPAVKWKKSLVTLNYAEKEASAFNLPNVPGVSVAPVSGNSKYKPVIPKCLKVALVNENTVKITAGQGMKLNKKYVVQLWLIYADSTDIKAVKKSFSVMLTDKNAGVSLKRVTGSSLDLSDRHGTAYHYRPVAKNSGLVVRDIGFKQSSASGNYILEKYFDEDTGELTDIWVRAKDEAALSKGRDEYTFDMKLLSPGKNSGSVNRAAYFMASRKTSKIRMAYISGNKLKINEKLSDNKIAGTIEVRAAAPKFGAVDPASIKDITCENGKISKDAFTSEWTLDEHGQAARIRIIVDRNKVTAGKKYWITFSLKAMGAARDTAPSKLKILYKAE